MTPLNVNLRHLIEQLDADLSTADSLSKVTEAQQRARTLSGIGDQLIDHFVSKAREAGTSWSQLGEALGVSKQAAQQRFPAGRWPEGAFSRFTMRARHVVVLAEERARDLRHGQVDTEHLLLGLLGEEEGLGGKVVISAAGSREAAENVVREALVPGSDNPRTHIPYSELSKSVLKATLDVALEMGHNYIGTEHILLGLLRVPECRGAQLLDRIGVTYQAAHAELVRCIEEIVAAKRAQAEGSAPTEGSAQAEDSAQAEGSAQAGSEPAPGPDRQDGDSQG
jgi:hypothetical protein